MTTTIEILPSFTDNYIYLIHWEKDAIVIDPGSAAPVLAQLEEEGLNLKAILLTHHHEDHIGGVKKLQLETGCELIGPNDDRIPNLDRKLVEGDAYDLLPFHTRVFEVPGHTSTHIAFYCPHEGWLFSGDSLFAGGCGRLFEGTPEQMWSSLQKLSELPDDTEIYCGHEYTQNNLLFAASIEPNNEEVRARLDKVEQQRSEGVPTIPSMLSEERTTNPFLRVQDVSLRKALDMPNATDASVFGEIRRRKDNF